jgi:hypothetical protein
LLPFQSVVGTVAYGTEFKHIFRELQAPKQNRRSARITFFLKTLDEANLGEFGHIGTKWGKNSDIADILGRQFGTSWDESDIERAAMLDGARI